MSGSSSTSTSAFQPDFWKINDNLYELSAPRAGVQRTMEIIFIHGLYLYAPEDAYWKTWTCQNECWPKTWLAHKLPSARVLSVAYDASVNQSDTEGRLDLYQIGENLVQNIIRSKDADLGSCPVFLVGHSLGGLVVKQLIILAEQKKNQSTDSDVTGKLQTFLNNLRGIFYFSCPHHGADIKRFTKFMTRISLSPQSPVTRALLTLSAEVERLNEDFRIWRKDHGLKAYAVNESEPTPAMDGYSHIVVKEGSGRNDVDIFYSAQANHFTVCAPESPATSTGTQMLLDLIREEGHPALHDDHPGNFQDFSQYVDPKQIDREVTKIKAKLLKFTSLGLVGMGGVGKTTLAKAVFNSLGPKYDYTCFIAMGTIQGGAEALKKAISKHLYHHGKKVKSSDRGLNLLQGKKLFLVLDDASDAQDLDYVLSVLRNRNIDEGSRFIATSRDLEVVSGLKDRYTVPYLDIDSARSFFTRLVFDGNETPPTLQADVDKVVKLCDGLPLTLEVVGMHLRSKNAEEHLGSKNAEKLWDETVQALCNAHDVGRFEEKIWRKLRISYDGLDKKQKGMFLDAATVFHGRFLSEAKQFWSSLHGYDETTWDRLVNLSLVKEVRIEGYYLIGMHEQLLSMGRNIALTSGEKGKCSRVWNSTKAIDFIADAENSSCYDDMEDIVAFQLPYGVPFLKVSWAARETKCDDWL